MNTNIYQRHNYPNIPTQIQHIPHPQAHDDFPGFVLYATFNANEILDLMRIVLNNNLNSKTTQDRIIHEISQQLIQATWKEKINRVLENVKIAVQTSHQNQSQQLDLSVFDELYDMIAFLQILGGLNPESAREYKIKHDFLPAFHFMVNLTGQISSNKWPDVHSSSPIGEQLRTERQKIWTLCISTIAEILNKNLPYFDSPEALTTCLKTVNESSGNFGTLLNPLLKRYYDRLQIEIFKAKLSNHQLHAILKSTLRLNEDISYIVDILPNDIRKFKFLAELIKKLDNTSPLFEKYRNVAKRCVVNSNDVDVVLQGMKSFPRDHDIKIHFFDKVSEYLSVWLNEFLTQPNPLNDENVKMAYEPLHRIMESLLSENDKQKLFSKVRETDVAQALAKLVERDIKDIRQHREPMAQDIIAILSQ